MKDNLKKGETWESQTGEGRGRRTEKKIIIF